MIIPITKCGKMMETGMSNLKTIPSKKFAHQMLIQNGILFNQMHDFNKRFRKFDDIHLTISLNF
jgi:hypothetical protein